MNSSVFQYFSNIISNIIFHFQEEIEELDEDVEYTIEALESEEEINFPEHKYARDISEDVEIKTPVKRIKIEMMVNFYSLPY